MQPLLYRTMQKMAMTVAVLLWFMVSYAQKAPQAFLERYDLSTTVINPDTAPTVPGHYIYAHAFNYDLQGNHLDVHETGTMDFQADGSALDSARQVYEVTLKEGGTVTLVFNYVSPSRWRLDGSDFYFSGIKEDFRMEVMETIPKGFDADRAAELAKEIVKTVGGSIDYEYKFHLDTLTAHKLQWSFLYRDGHSDTWEFYR